MKLKDCFGIPSKEYGMLFINPLGTKGFGTHTKHQGGGVKKDPPQYLKNDNCYKPGTFRGASFKVSKNFKFI